MSLMMMCAFGHRHITYDKVVNIVIIIEYCKTQLICLLVLAYVGLVYIREGVELNKLSKKTNCNYMFDALFIISEIAVLFDGITACTVNFTDVVPDILNRLLHLGLYVSYELFVTTLFVYWISKIYGGNQKKHIRIYYIIFCVVSIILTIAFLPQMTYVQGTYTSYSMGISVYICYACVAIYCLFTVAAIYSKRRFIQKKKRTGIATTLLFVVLIMTLQIIFPESLITCCAVVMVVISIYLNMENPSILALEHYHREMVMGFATLVENKDDSTGGHIRRSSAYAVMIARKMRKSDKYKDTITKDYIENLEKSAPMHDIGKIGIPDSILQKPGKLTEQEFETMKQHPVIGGRIIKDTFGHLFDGEYEDMAYQVAVHHHEKWNGRGYPNGLSKENIPLCARIMAVADVFDAVSAKRCYRDALPLDKCYEIIEKGRGEDFDPDVVDAFMESKDEISRIMM